MRRRAFVLGAGAMLTVPHAPEAQQVPRIGWLTNSDIHTRNVDAFRQGMRALGYGDLRFEFRAARGRVDSLAALAAELVALNVDVIVTDGGPAAIAARYATTTIPIVIGAATSEFLMQDRVVGSLARPGANITGFTISTGPELYGKRIELLRDAMPHMRRVIVVWNPRNEGARMALPSIEHAAASMDLQFRPLAAPDIEQLERGLSTGARKDADAVVFVADAFFWSQRVRVVSLTARHRLAAIYPEPEFAVEGGLLAYGTIVSDNFRRAAGHVDKILKGVKPGDIPIEQPTKFALLINLKTAKTLGLTIPPSLLARADEVIE